LGFSCHCIIITNRKIYKYFILSDDMGKLKLHDLVTGEVIEAPDKPELRIGRHRDNDVPIPSLDVRDRRDRGELTEIEQCALTIAMSVSNDHARIARYPVITMEQGEKIRDWDYSLSDLMSTNGTYVNGRKLEGVRRDAGIGDTINQVRLNNHDKIRFGPYEMEVLIE